MDSGQGSIFTTIKSLKEQVEAINKDKATEINSEIRHATYRFLGRVVFYDPVTALLVLEDYDEDEGEFSAKQATSDIEVDVQMVSQDDNLLTRNCITRGEWIHVIGSVATNGTSNPERLVVRATIIWHCEYNNHQKLRLIIRKWINQLKELRPM
ncbi:hypothetical protein V1511DRAFT_493255 [Dipodascopsis uninucleata]